MSRVPPLTHKVKMSSVRSRDVALQVAAPAVGAESGIFIANRSDADVEIPAGTLVAGFYSGKWVTNPTEDQVEPEKDVAFNFTMTGPDSQVLLGGVLMTLLEAVERAPARKIQYHNLEPDPQPGNPGHFLLTLKNNVFFKCNDLPAVIKTEDEGEPGPALGVTQAHVASALPPAQWQTQRTDIIWTVRYHPAKGLAPVRPQVLLKEALVLKAQSAVKL